MSAGVGMAVGRAIIRDLHEGPQAQKLMATISMIFSIAPAIAPVLGGWIHVWFGWRFVFGFMVITGVSLVVLELPAVARDASVRAAGEARFRRAGAHARAHRVEPRRSCCTRWRSARRSPR